MYLLVGYKDVSFSHPQKNTKVDKMGQKIHSWFFQVWFLFKLHSKSVSKYVGTHSSTLHSCKQLPKNPEQKQELPSTQFKWCIK